MAESHAQPGSSQYHEPTGLLDVLLTQLDQGHDADALVHAKDSLQEFVDMGLKVRIRIDRSVREWLRDQIRQLDQMISRQLDPILHSPEFQRLEAQWRGMHYILSYVEPKDEVQIRVLNASKRDLWRDFNRSSSIDQCALFGKFYDEELGTFGGRPFGVLLGSYEFDSESSADFFVLRKMGNIAAQAHAPFIAAAAPQFVGLNSYSELSHVRDLSTSPTNIQWELFQKSDESRWIALTCPRILLREPYHPATAQVDAFSDEEHVSRHDDYLWGSGVWALGACIANAFLRDGWYASIRGIGGGGMVDGLAVHELKTDSGDIDITGPTEVAIDYARAKQLADLGLIPVAQVKRTSSVVFDWVGMVHRSAAVTRAGVKEGRPMSTDDLRVILCASRFAHYLVLQSRNEQCARLDSLGELGLQQWLNDYVGNRASTVPDARRPLRAARLRISEGSARDGSAVVILEIWPAYLMEDVQRPFTLALTLPPSPPRHYSRLVDAEDESRTEIAQTQIEGSVSHTEPTSVFQIDRNGDPFQLHALVPHVNPRSMLDAISHGLDGSSAILSSVVLGPLMAKGEIAAQRPVEELVEFAAREPSRVQLDVTELVQLAALPLSRLAFLVRYPSGALRGLSAEIHCTDNHYILRLLDPLSLLDPELLIEHQPSAPLACEFDVLILQTPAHVD